MKMLDRIDWIRGKWLGGKDDLLMANLLRHTHLLSIDPNQHYEVGLMVVLNSKSVELKPNKLARS